MELPFLQPDGPSTPLRISMLGPLAVFRSEEQLKFPPSRKVRALLAYLAIAPRPIGRSRLCEVLGDVPNDPRGELRWCLSKLRTILDAPGRSRVLAKGEMISLDLADCFVDALQVEEAMRAGLESLSTQQLRSLGDLFLGDFLDGLDLNRSPQLDHWVVSQRRRYRACHAAILEQLTRTVSDDPREHRSHVERWVELAPIDARAQILLLKTLLEYGSPGEAGRHFEATVRLFEAEDADVEPIRRAWHEFRKQKPGIPSGKPALPVAAEAAGISESVDIIIPTRQRRASLAVMPFTEPGSQEVRNRLADGLTHDIITRLAKLRNLFVIARGSVFALADRGVGPEDAARRLDVDYFATGMVMRQTDRTLVEVELVETRTARIVWAEEFRLKPDDTFLVLDDIGNMIVTSIANEIETAEKNRAILKHPNSLDAWEAYHRGLWHMYRFTRSDNDLAQQFFQRSSEEDPTFARAFAGLSFTHWQNAFQHWGDRQRETDLALETAGRSLVVDDHDPAAHWAMGRALWLRSRNDQAIDELERAVDLSPNFALGHYALSFVHSQSGDPAAAIASSDHSRSLSPFDPLLFGMLGTRALALVRLGQFEEAAQWAMKAAARPNAHHLIQAIAAHCLALAGRIEEGKIFAATIRQAQPGFRVAELLAAFRFSPDAEALFRKGAKQIGLD